MSKRVVVGLASRPPPGRPAPSDSLNEVEGRIVEICRDLTLAAKRMRQLRDQGDELRRAIRRWTG